MFYKLLSEFSFLEFKKKDLSSVKHIFFSHIFTLNVLRNWIFKWKIKNDVSYFVVILKKDVFESWSLSLLRILLFITQWNFQNIYINPKLNNYNILHIFIYNPRTYLHGSTDYGTSI